jgi:hypothetical protein
MRDSMNTARSVAFSALLTKLSQTREYILGMQSTLSIEDELIKVVQITSRKLRKLRLSNKVPFIKVDRYTRLYSVEKVPR